MPSDDELDLILKQYSNDLPRPELLSIEVQCWKHHLDTCGTNLTDKFKITVTQILDFCDKDIFPNINTLLVLAATLPVTTCECERSFSCLRRLRRVNTYLRTTQSSDKLDYLALIHVYCRPSGRCLCKNAPKKIGTHLSSISSI